MMLPSYTSSELMERLSQWTLSVVIIIVIVVIIIVNVLCNIRRRRRLDEGSGTRHPPPAYVNSSSKTTSPDSWLQTVMEWAWLRHHVTWKHVADCGINAWMTALTDQANRQAVSAISANPITFKCIL